MNTIILSLISSMLVRIRLILKSVGYLTLVSILFFATRSEAACNSVPNMLTARRAFAAVLDSKGLLYAIGGLDENDTVLDKVEVYDPNTKTWQQRSSLPKPLYGHSATLGSDGRIYVIGGYQSDEVLVYNVMKNVWSAHSKLPVSLYGASAFTSNSGQIYNLGGNDGKGRTADVRFYNSKKSSWLNTSQMNCSRQDFALAQTDSGNIYVRWLPFEWLRL
jgi:hypothetical protein